MLTSGQRPGVFLELCLQNFLMGCMWRRMKKRVKNSCEAFVGGRAGVSGCRQLRWRGIVGQLLDGKKPQPFTWQAHAKI